ncbi:MAG: hypothetical protein H0T50_12795 [Gemmatimonadales bacterium]|nr:hypothetical protein [Gemmatimonadales bacterium]
MYLVELRPGKEELYRTGDDLTAAIRSGEVDGLSRIYHRSTSKWISITLHPQYKAIVAEKPGHPADRSDWTYLTDQAETLESSVTEVEAAPDSDPGAEPESGQDAGDGSNGGSPWRRPVTLGISGLFLMFGIQLAFSGPRPSWSANAAGKPGEAPTAPAAKQTDSSQVVSLASSSTAWSAEEAYRDEPSFSPGKPPVELPKAPQLAAKSLDLTIDAPVPADEPDGKTIEGLLAAYGKAYDSSRSRLGSGIRVARLNQLFASPRLTPDGGITDTRLNLAGVANFIRVYREQEGAIEREFQDSFTTLSKDLGWSPKTAKRWYSREGGKESPALVSLTDRLVAGIDSVLAVLSAEAGTYKLVDDQIHFEDKAIAREYGELRRSVNAAVDSARIAGGEESAGPMGYLLKAIGTTRLPQEN